MEKTIVIFKPDANKRDLIAPIFHLLYKNKFHIKNMKLVNASSKQIIDHYYNNLSGVSEIIKNKENGILINMNIPSDFEKAIEYVKSKEIRDKLSENSLENIKKYYPRNILIRQIEYYKKIINEKSKEYVK